ncbi:phage head morphogenesis protein [Desulfovibrio cuneatus]|uniref:phage head morphogenesis protein n=1 Tax=Desulfovibrio cuneatus TaxID=159728 RepID=UPI000410D66A|nr:phage head morphogenesis protein [Desulfovibrio cuneatus]
MEITATSLPPKEAIDFWETKVPMGRKEYDALADEARSRAFFVGGLAKGDMLQAVKDSLRKALQEGTSFAQWKKDVGPVLEAAGWPGNPQRLETIFRTNMQSAYMAGRYAQQKRTVALRPYWQMSGVNDSRTRPSHAALHEVVYPADHEFWDTYYPPNGFR